MRVPWFKCPSRSPLAKCKGQVQPDPLRSQTQTPTKCAGDAIPQKLVTSYGQRHWLTSNIVSCTIPVPTEVIEQAGPLCPMVAKHTHKTPSHCFKWGHVRHKIQPLKLQQVIQEGLLFAFALLRGFFGALPSSPGEVSGAGGGAWCPSWGACSSAFSTLLPAACSDAQRPGSSRTLMPSVMFGKKPMQGCISGYL